VAALAHPLGNFTINHYSRLELARDSLRVRYVVDMAEIPTFQAMATLDANGDGQVSDSERDAYATKALAQMTRNLHVALGGAEQPLRVAAQQVELLPGQAGLQTLRLSAWLEAPAAAQALERAGAQPLSLDYRDDNDAERIGWREIVVHAEDVAVSGSGALPTQDVSDELRRYPDDMLSSPLDRHQVRLVMTPGASAHGQALSGAATQRTGNSPSLARAGDGFTEALTHASSVAFTPGVVALALVTALALGAMHALSPGHGKTIVGAYLVGARGTPRHALFLGATVTTVHTAGVFALGLATLFASRYVVPDRIYPWMSLASGLLVLATGLTLLRSRLRRIVVSPKSLVLSRDHDHGAPASGDLGLRTQDLGLVHDHGFGAHGHVVPGGRGGPVTWRSLLALGASGGLLPCPSALVVMLGAIALHRVTFGLVLIVAFSLGLASTLVAIGLLMVYSGRAAGRLRLAERLGMSTGTRLGAALRFVPALSTGVVALAGLALAADAAQQLGVSVSSIVAALAPASLGVQVQRALHAGSLALLGTALVLGLRHGIDWDHVAAIADITSGTAGRLRRSDLRALWLAMLYALGHALVVVLLGVAALEFAAILPAWVDPLMERVVGATLLALGFWVVYSLVRYWRGGGDFRLQSRWMLVFAGVRRLRQSIEATLHGHEHGVRGAWHAHGADQYGPRTAFAVGAIHGIGAETGTQVLIIAAVGGAASQGMGLWLLLAFVAGLLLSNTALAFLASTGFVTSSRAKTLYLAAGCLAAVFSLVVGAAFTLGAAGRLPDLQQLIAFVGGGAG
jgi:ABC-type nickel/cobalt efflux system permease component RcnA